MKEMHIDDTLAEMKTQPSPSISTKNIVVIHTQETRQLLIDAVSDLDREYGTGMSDSWDEAVKSLSLKPINKP